MYRWVDYLLNWKGGEEGAELDVAMGKLATNTGKRGNWM